MVLKVEMVEVGVVELMVEATVGVVMVVVGGCGWSAEAEGPCGVARADGPSSRWGLTFCGLFLAAVAGAFRSSVLFP